MQSRKSDKCYLRFNRQVGGRDFSKIPPYFAAAGVLFAGRDIDDNDVTDAYRRP